MTSNLPGLDITVTGSQPAETVRMDIRLIPDAIKRGMLSGVIRLGTSDPKFPEIAVPVRGEIQ